AMPASFFEQRPHMKGAEEQGHFAMCTSVPEVRQWLTESLASVFADVPDLGGVFTITASENLTNCPSRGGHQQCPRCKERPIPEIIAEVNTAIEAGVHRGNPDARVLVWDWAWRNEWAEPIIQALPDRVSLMSVSEWDLPIQRGGVSTAVGEYSISSVGPGPRAQAHWALARQRGLPTMAKVQVNCTWELSAVPYLPAMDLVAQHMANLAQAGVDGLMLSWTLGGYPSPNLQLASLFFGDSPPATPEEALTRLAVDRYGPKAAGHARRAWSAFSAGFAEFPYHGSTVYNAPMQYGPMNLLHPEPTGFHATMVGFPYDDLDRWRSVYPADVFGRQFEKVADGWRKGLDGFREALTEATEPAHRANLTEDLRVAEAAWIHFASVANQIRFTLARNTLASATLPAEQRAVHRATMKAACEDEIELAKRLFHLTRQDSRIGFEASNHYYYLPLDLVEKVIDCTDILEHRLPD
ncbi:MAG: hypothetical protein JXA69_04245, partial [Phycisphaerae bacterium]|nr:hypothetical protein [Phycisphaerae bacterium]